MPEDVSGAAAPPTSVISVTPEARDRILEVRDGENDPESLALWLEVTGASGNAYTYDMYFRATAEAGPDDAIATDGGLTVVVPARDVDKVRGATLDVSGGGMVLQNPNSPPAPGAVPRDIPEADLSSPVAQRILAILDEQINPAIAAHGGFAELIAVEEQIAYLRMGGGCQGCGLAAVTLSQGIEVAILEQVPEITSVVDVTDHASGTNPYYEAAKK
jgi:Fe/S biogenesis protein NfuA